jgi:hypothetical protein
MHKRYVVLTPRGNRWKEGGPASICDACLPIVTAELKPGWKLKEVPTDQSYVCFHCAMREDDAYFSHDGRPRKDCDYCKDAGVLHCIFHSYQWW